MSQPIPVRVLRHKCPHCGRTASRPGRAREHIARCWHNPDAKGCKTCKHFVTYHGSEYGDHCDAGVSLAGRPACSGCGGSGWADTNVGASAECSPERSASHVGDGSEIRPGPVVGCDRWEASPDCNANSICPARAECAAENACRITRARRGDLALIPREDA